ncbi:conserved exported hypothetical protein [Crenothrix polyspora]|uniref:DUF4124 domain-containing protein n=2 Tax=Crenothrix polyspora TaxID=360316 RepID=A0A1R4H9N0_9GAMM|nr:conserved exported hypothetical protein [Crenothrix polyspora]
MSHCIVRVSVFLSCLCCLLSSQTAIAKKMYRWVDDQGKTFFSDQVPPKHNQFRRDSLSKKGRVIEVIEKAKTKEQITQDNRLAELRKEQDKLIATQKTHDKALLSTFHSKEDLINGLNAKFETLDSEKKIIAGNLEQLKTLLNWQQKQAALLERDGKKVPQKSLTEMQSTQEQIKKTERSALVNMQKKQQIETEYKANFDRFVYLTEPATDEHEVKLASIIEANKLGLFYCHNDHQCNKAWDIGHKFVNFYSTTPADIYNDKLIMNRLPATDSDLSLSLSKIKLTDTNYQLFLDIRCRDSSQGRELCAGQKVSSIRASFRPYINNALARAAQE